MRQEDFWGSLDGCKTDFEAEISSPTQSLLFPEKGR
jgi:hypothetical protein